MMVEEDQKDEGSYGTIHSILKCKKRVHCPPCSTHCDFSINSRQKHTFTQKHFYPHVNGLLFRINFTVHSGSLGIVVTVMSVLSKDCICNCLFGETSKQCITSSFSMLLVSSNSPRLSTYLEDQNLGCSIFPSLTKETA